MTKNRNKDRTENYFLKMKIGWKRNQEEDGRKIEWNKIK